MWVRIDDNLDQNPKITAISNDALALFVCGLTYSNRNLTDGFIPKQVGLGQLRYCENGTLQAIGELEGQNMWIPSDTGWQIHDYLKFNPSKEEVLNRRGKTKERVNRHRNSVSNGVTDSVTGSVTNANVTALQTQSVHGNPESRIPVPESRNQSPGTSPPSPPAGGKRVRRARLPFEEPSEEEVEAEFARHGHGGKRLGKKWLLKYQGNGWKLNDGNPIKDWKAVVGTWCEREQDKLKSGGKSLAEEAKEMEMRLRARGYE